MAVATCAIAHPALAMNIDGRWGIGFEETLTSLEARLATLGDVAQPVAPAAGLSVRGHVGYLALESIVGLSLHKPGALRDANDKVLVDSPPLEMGAFLSLGALYHVFRAPQVNLALGLRVLGGIGRVNDNAGRAGPWQLGVAFEAPLRVEWHFNPNFAIAAAVGGVIIAPSANGNPLSGQRDVTQITATRGQFAGGLGFTYYWD
jgi:hypothetical protein